ncbi:hypothetical protein BDM02DRAFT_1258998 [Thelephora ganbajun]|uniref:Uncharacterized protein n=1 Tax=Thelephora ganbajun TaxID=370292 RepID=A0ACB6ZNU1_THEGA|nr:hypothetical protein BDM02DRAFT_1258998 [Thelephora ganbajun]
MNDLSWFKARGDQPGCLHMDYHLLHRRVVMVLIIALPNTRYTIFLPIVGGVPRPDTPCGGRLDYPGATIYRSTGSSESRLFFDGLLSQFGWRRRISTKLVLWCPLRPVDHWTPSDQSIIDRGPCRMDTMDCTTYSQAVICG